MDRQSLRQITGGMDGETWRRIPVELVAVDIVKLIHEQVSIESLLSAASAGLTSTGDPFPHLVSINHDLWAEDGDSHILIWRIRGCELMPMRVLRVES